MKLFENTQICIALNLLQAILAIFAN